MGRKSKTQQLAESVLGQHLALSVAAHLARTQLAADPLRVDEAQHASESLDVVANALAKVAPLYAQDAMNGSARLLSAAELEGATVRRAATVLALTDGRTLSSVSMKRADLRQAIAILKAVGVPGLASKQPEDLDASKPEPRPPLIESVEELEALLRFPLNQAHVEKANRLAVAIARHARQGRVANLAMQVVSAVHESNGEGNADSRRLAVALAQLRAAVQDLDCE